MKDIYDDVANHYRLRLPALEEAKRQEQPEVPKQDRFEQVARRLRDEERAVAVQLRDQDRIGDEVLRSLLRELDLLDARASE
jgi:hypothetical protein